MTIPRIAASAAALIAALLLATMILAAQEEAPQPNHGMNRHLYLPRTSVKSAYVPRHGARRPVIVPPAVAQMNRKLYSR
ncbi:MAG: hypothetical protein R3E44_13245 [Paracoccaceae bacterium]